MKYAFSVNLHTPPMHEIIGRGVGGGSNKNKNNSPANSVTVVCIREDFGRRCKVFLKHKIERTASCSSSSASAANSPFLIPSEFLLVSSSERGNWYRVFRAFNRICGKNRISMLINKKWKNVRKFCIHCICIWTKVDQVRSWSRFSGK